MKPTDESLQRLLNAAAKTAAEAPAAPPLGLETRVLANWRAGRADDESASLFAFFRHAMVGASLVLVLSAAWSLRRRRARRRSVSPRLRYPDEPEPMNTLGRWKLGLYVIAIFLAGGGSGAFITWQICQNRVVTPSSPEEIGARLRARFQSRLGLTPEQVQKINPLIDQAMRQVDVIRHDTANHVFANVSNLHEQVLLVLTPEQKVKFEQLERERREHLRQKFGPASNAP
jgi:hypothetical protein